MHFAYSDGKLDFRCILRVLGEIIYFRWKTRFPMENSIFDTFCVFWVKLLISPSAGGSGDDQKCDTSFLGFSHERGWAGGGIPGASAQQTSASLCSIAEDFGFPESGTRSQDSGYTKISLGRGFPIVVSNSRSARNRFHVPLRYTISRPAGFELEIEPLVQTPGRAQSVSAGVRWGGFTRSRVGVPQNRNACAY